jgi:hydrogenase maturation factor HypE
VVPRSWIAERPNIYFVSSRSAARRLLSVQEKQNAPLISRVDAAQTILKEALPTFLRRSEDKVNLPTDIHIERQQHACQELTAVLEEIIQVVKEVRGDYDNTFMDTVMNDSTMTEAQKKLNGALKNVTSMLAKLHATAEDAEKEHLKEQVAGEARNVAAAIKETGGDEDDTIEFVQAVKQGVQESNKDFFQAQKRINAVASKASKPVHAVSDDSSKDMLEAAKDMLSALKGVSSALSDAPELKGIL